MQPGDVPLCAAILESVRPWFGQDDSNRAFVESLRVLPAAVALSPDGATVVGFIAVAPCSPRAAEIRVMAVERALHRRGFGRSLVEWGEEWCRREGTSWLHVKTLGPSTPDEGYERTRAFYVALGYEPLFESRTMWSGGNAALILVKHLACPDRESAAGIGGRGAW
jgi:GNAT superfamily N-acetyltransferase